MGVPGGRPPGSTRQFEVLRLLDDKDTACTLCEKIGSADIVYVGGGNTKKMIEGWKKRKVDVLLKKAFERGIILSGLSAGSIFWFEKGISDSNSFESEEWEYCFVNGLGIVPGCYCPHYGDRRGELKFKDFVTTNRGKILAVENCCSLVAKNGKYWILKGHENAKAYIIESKNGEIEEMEIGEEGMLDEIV